MYQRPGVSTPAVCEHVGSCLSRHCTLQEHSHLGPQPTPRQGHESHESHACWNGLISIVGPTTAREWLVRDVGSARTSGSRSGPIRSTSTDVVGVVTLTTTAERREVARRGRGAVSDRVSSHGQGEKQFGLSNTYAYGRACVAMERPCRTAACPRPRWFARIGGIEEVRGSPHHSPPAVLRRTQPLPARRPEAAACCTDKGWAASGTRFHRRFSMNMYWEIGISGDA